MLIKHDQLDTQRQEYRPMCNALRRFRDRQYLLHKWLVDLADLFMSIQHDLFLKLTAPMHFLKQVDTHQFLFFF